jgi:hypothetical protein
MDNKPTITANHPPSKRAHLRKWVVVREPGEKQNKTFLTQPTSLEM